VITEEFEDTKGIIRIRKSKKNSQHNGKKKRDKQRSTKHTHNKTKDQWSISQKVVSLRSVVSVNFNQSKAWKSHLR